MKMNKYQEAIEKLRNSKIKLHVFVGQTEEIEAPTIFDFYHSEIFALQELVEKATPKKVTIETIVDGFDDGDFGGTFEYKKATCPNCEGILIDETEEVDLEGYDYCPNCGQALDWSDDE